MKAGLDERIEFGELRVQVQHASRDPGHHVHGQLLSGQCGVLGFRRLDDGPGEWGRAPGGQAFSAIKRRQAHCRTGGPRAHRSLPGGTSADWPALWRTPSAPDARVPTGPRWSVPASVPGHSRQALELARPRQLRSLILKRRDSMAAARLGIAGRAPRSARRLKSSAHDGGPGAGGLRVPLSGTRVAWVSSVSQRCLRHIRTCCRCVAGAQGCLETSSCLHTFKGASWNRCSVCHWSVPR
ncbi:hypothetical protein FHS40_007010 [Streptomyces spectabilis]|uniref:Uncharacterized protein n=1 Tax=Streptomyces spectabilis TaxID=68270 RepID=A0A7W8B053_STRST|nr:hypothetical protein [Streptomyces spectabilis]